MGHSPISDRGLLDCDWGVAIMGEIPFIVEGHINDSDSDLIERVNKDLTKILGEPFYFTTGRITRVTEEIAPGYKENGYVAVWID
jgi:hypothetical protein